VVRARPQVGEREVLIASPGHSSAHPDRRGRIIELLGSSGSECYLVRWPDGGTSVLPAGAISDSRTPTPGTGEGSGRR